MNFLHFCLFFAPFWIIGGTFVSVQAENDAKQCYNSSMSMEIDYSRFLNGTWLEKERSPNSFEYNCDGLRYIIIGDNFQMTLLEDNKTFIGNYDNVSASILIDDYYMYSVINTDYENYAVVYACKKLEDDPISEFIWVLSRDDQMTNSSDTLLAEHEPLKELLKDNECQVKDTSTVKSSSPTSPSVTSDAPEDSPTSNINTTTTPSQTTVNPGATSKFPEEPTTTLRPLMPAFSFNGRRVFLISQLLV